MWFGLKKWFRWLRFFVIDLLKFLGGDYELIVNESVKY